MSKLDLSKYGITDVKEILHNPSYEELFKAETDPSLTGYEKGQASAKACAFSWSEQPMVR